MSAGTFLMTKAGTFTAESVERLVAERQQAIDALRARREFAALVLECDEYGCDTGPNNCLHGKARREVEAIDAALVRLGEKP